MWGYAPLYANVNYRALSNSRKVQPVSPVKNRNSFSPISPFANQLSPNSRNKPELSVKQHNPVQSFSSIDAPSIPLAVHVGNLYTETWLHAVKQSAPAYVNVEKVAELYENKRRPSNQVNQLG